MTKNRKPTCDPELTRRVLNVLRYYGTAVDHRMTKSEILAAVGMGYRTDRQVRMAIEDLRKQGIPIMATSGQSGYWIATSPDEMREYAAEINSRIVEMRASLRAIKQYWELQKQMELSV